MLRISLRPSRLLAVLLTLAHAAAISIVLIVNLPHWLKAVASVVLIVQWVLAVRRQALLQGAGAVTALEVTSDHRVNIETRSAGWCEYDVLGSTYVTSYLTILNLRQSGNRAAKHVPLLRDSLNSEDFRQLRIWLRWKQDSVRS